LYARVKVLKVDMVALWREISALRVERAQLVMAREMVQWLYGSARRWCKSINLTMNWITQDQRLYSKIWYCCRTCSFSIFVAYYLKQLYMQEP